MRETNSKLPSLSLKKFSQLFFNSCPLLRQWSADHEQLFDEFMHMKVRVPVCGAIMLNDKWDKVRCCVDRRYTSDAQKETVLVSQRVEIVRRMGIP